MEVSLLAEDVTNKVVTYPFFGGWNVFSDHRLSNPHDPVADRAYVTDKIADFRNNVPPNTKLYMIERASTMLNSGFVSFFTNQIDVLAPIIQPQYGGAVTSDDGLADVQYWYEQLHGAYPAKNELVLVIAWSTHDSSPIIQRDFIYKVVAWAASQSVTDDVNIRVWPYDLEDEDWLCQYDTSGLLCNMGLKTQTGFVDKLSGAFGCPLL